MIKYNPKTWFNQIFLFHRSDTLRILWPEMILMGMYSGALTYLLLSNFPNAQTFKNTLSVHSLVGVVMGLFLVFRTNSAYDRWWEGRKQWGSLVNSSRNLSIKISTFISDDVNEKREILQLISIFPYVAKEHLRSNPDLSEAKTILPENIIREIESWEHLPNGIIRAIYARIKKLNARSILSTEELIIIDNELTEFLDMLGACERIKSSPIPFSYILFMKKFIFLYCITLPIGLISDFLYWTIPITMFIFYVMVSLEILAEEIEDPFGKDDNDLPTDEIAERIKSNVGEIIGK